MGYYIQTTENHDKAQAIVKSEPTAIIVTQADARNLVTSADVGIIVVVNNGSFEAAAFAFSMEEFNVFTDPGDHRLKIFVAMNRARAEELSGYKVGDPR